jgi:hypothetical protein
MEFDGKIAVLTVAEGSLDGAAAIPDLQIASRQSFRIGYL